MTDPDDGAPIVRAVYKRDDIYSGRVPAQRLGAAGRHATTAIASRGRRRSADRRQGIVYPNMKKWSGDHGGYDFATTAGVLIVEPAGSTSASPSIMDIAPTVLKYFGLQIPGGHRRQAFF